jgi:hypothetical protein
VQNPNMTTTTEARANQRLIRSHAIKLSLGAKRMETQGRRENFYAFTPANQKGKRNTREERIVDVSVSVDRLAAGKLDPFDCLAADGERLQDFLGHRKFYFPFAIALTPHQIPYRSRRCSKTSR